MTIWVSRVQVHSGFMPVGRRRGPGHGGPARPSDPAWQAGSRAWRRAWYRPGRAGSASWEYREQPAVRSCYAELRSGPTPGPVRGHQGKAAAIGISARLPLGGQVTTDSPEDSRDSKSGPSSSSTGSSSPNCRLGERTFFPESESKTGSARVIGGQALSPPTFLRSPVAPRNVTDTVMQRIFISKHNFNYS